MNKRLLRTLGVFFIVGVCIVHTTVAGEINETWEEKYNDELYVYQLIEEEIKLNKDWSYDRRVHYVIKIQKDGAKDSGIGDITFAYNQTYEKIKSVRAWVFDTNGTKTPCKAAQDLAPFSGQPMYSDNRVKVISMPKVMTGSTIEYEVKVHCRKPYIPDTFCYVFDISQFVPIKLIRYQLQVPKDVAVRIRNQNIDIQPLVKYDSRLVTYKWQMENNNKVETEENMPPDDDILAEIQVSTVKEWREIDSWYRDLVTKNLPVSAEMKEEVQKLIADKKSKEEKAQAIIKYVQQNVRYISMSFGKYNYEPHPASDVFANKYGDCKDQTMLVIALLKEAGITAYPCLFRDESTGSPATKLPMPMYFDHVILALELGQGMVFTDILLKGYRLNEIPVDIQGAYLLLINGQGGQWTRLPVLDESLNSTVVSTNMVIKSDGSALVEQKRTFSQDYSAELVERWKNYTEKEQKEFIENVSGRIAVGGKVYEHKFEHIDEEYGRVQQIIKCDIPQWTEVSGGFMSFNAGVINRSSIFTKQERNYAIWFRYNYIERGVTMYHLPDGYVVENIPKDKNVSCPFMDFSRTYQRLGEKIIETQVLRYKRILLRETEYKMVQDFFDKLTQLSKEKIILKKK